MLKVSADLGQNIEITPTSLTPLKQPKATIHGTAIWPDIDFLQLMYLCMLQLQLEEVTVVDESMDS